MMTDEVRLKYLHALESPELTASEKCLLQIIRTHEGASNAIKSRAIGNLLNLDWNEHTRRWIASTVETLVLLHGIPVGASRCAPQGYFLIETQSDLDIAVNARWKEVYAHFRHIKALTSPEKARELLGQRILDLENVEAK